MFENHVYSLSFLFNSKAIYTLDDEMGQLSAVVALGTGSLLSEARPYALTSRLVDSVVRTRFNFSL